MDEYYRQLVEKGDVKTLIESSKHGLQADSEEVAEQAQEALVAIGGPAIRPLSEALSAFAFDARVAIAQQKGLEEEWDNGEPAAHWAVDRQIRQLLNNGTPNPCMRPAITLARIGQEAAQPLLECAEHGRDWLAREAAIKVLGHVADKRAIPVLKASIRLLRRDRVSMAARRAIRAIKGREG